MPPKPGQVSNTSSVFTFRWLKANKKSKLLFLLIYSKKLWYISGKWGLKVQKFLSKLLPAPSLILKNVMFMIENVKKMSLYID